MRWRNRLVACLVSMVLALMVGGVLSAQDEQAILQNIMDEFVGENNAALAIQVTVLDESWTAASGMADATRAAKPTDRFRIGSMSKTFVAVAALMLVDDGVFKLDDPARNWLPAEVVKNIANVDTVTIRQLLAMRSGIDDYLGTEAFNEAIFEDPTRDWTAEDALTYAYDLEPLFAPDEDYFYSNTNYLLLQLVLEKAAGQPLHVLIRERLIKPLDLKDTYTQARETQPGGFVYGYEDVDQDGTVDEVSGFNDGAGLGDGALISTVADVTTFYKALLHDETLLSDESMAELLRFEDDGEDGGYSLGLATYESDFGAAIGHTGGVVGFVSAGFYLPEVEAIVVVLSADSSVDPSEIADAAAEALLNEGENE